MSHTYLHLQMEPWEILAALTVGFFGLVTIYNRWRDDQVSKSDKKEARKNKLEDDLITRFEQRIEQIENDRTEDLKKIQQLELAVLELRKQNELLIKLNTERDDISIEFRKVMLNAAKIAERADTKANENNVLLIEVSKQNVQINKNIAQLFSIIEKHLKVIEGKEVK